MHASPGHDNARASNGCPGHHRQGDAVRRPPALLASRRRRAATLHAARGLHRGRPPRHHRGRGGLRCHHRHQRRAGRPPRRAAGRRRYHAAEPHGRWLLGRAHGSIRLLEQGPARELVRSDDLDRGAGRRVLSPLRRRARQHRSLPPEVRAQGRRSAGARQHLDLRGRRGHRGAGPGRRTPQRRGEVAADGRLRRVGIGWLLGCRAEARGLGRDRRPRRVARARLPLDQRRRRRVPRCLSPVGADHRRGRGSDHRGTG
jgi:hypothetical protein